MPAENQEATGKKYYYELDYFRGFAILGLVWSNLALVSEARLQLQLESGWEKVLNIFQMSYSPGTAWFFVFISGFLYYGVFWERQYSYWRFMKDKLLKVFTPFLIFTILFGAWFAHTYVEGPLSLTYFINAFYTYWYIPMIMCVFIMAPVWDLYIKAPLKWQLLVFLLSVILSIGTGRNNLNPLIGVLNFASAYLLGILVALNYEKIKAWHMDIQLTIIYLTILLANALTASGISAFEYESPERWSYAFFKYPAACLPIKLAFCMVWFFAFAWLHRSSHFIAAVLKSFFSLLAEYAFTIYFFQLFIIWFFNYFSLQVPASLIETGFWGVQIFYFLSSIAICLLIVLLAYYPKRALGKYSRPLLGC